MMEVLYQKTLYKVNLAIMLIDDFTGKTLHGPGYLFYANEIAVHPIRKPDGYFVITGLSSDTYSLKIASPWYCTHEVLVSPDRHPDGNAPLLVRLHPGTAYSMLSGVTAYSGAFLSKQQKTTDVICVKLMTELSGGRIKLKSVQKKDKPSGLSVITLQNPDGNDMTGTTIAFGNDKENAPMETAVLERRLEGNAYETSADLKKAYSSATPLYRVFSAVTDNNGQVLIPVDCGKQTEADVFLEAVSGKKAIYGKRHLTAGVITRYDEVI